MTIKIKIKTKIIITTIKNKTTYPLYVVPKSTPTIRRSLPTTEAADAKEEPDDRVAVRGEPGWMFNFPKASDSGRAMFKEKRTLLDMWVSEGFAVKSEAKFGSAWICYQPAPHATRSQS